MTYVFLEKKLCISAEILGVFAEQIIQLTEDQQGQTDDKFEYESDYHQKQNKGQL